MKSINKKASRHGGKEITTKKIKELGAQAEKELYLFNTLDNEPFLITVLELPPLV